METTSGGASLTGMKVAALLLLASTMAWADHNDSKHRDYFISRHPWYYFGFESGDHPGFKPGDFTGSRPATSVRMPEPSASAELALGGLFILSLAALRKRA